MYCRFFLRLLLSFATLLSFQIHGRANTRFADQNVPPVITGQNTVATDEDGSVTIAFGDLVVSDPDNTYPDGFTLTVYAGDNYSRSGNVVTPNANFNGTLSVQVSVNDGTDESAVFDLQIQVNAVNDAPVITGQSAITTGEEQAVSIAFGHLTVNDPDNAYPNGFTLSVTGGSNYSVSGTTVTPNADFSGVLNVPVSVNDGLATSNTFTLQIQVDAGNDAPVITGQTPLSTNEDQPVTIMLANLQVSDSDNTYPNGFTLSVGAGSNYSATGSTITPATNFSGTLTLPVTVNDGTSNSAPFSFSITVTPINDPPTITAQDNISTGEDTPRTLTFDDFAVSDPDNTYPMGFTLTVSPGTNYTVTDRTITPATDFVGTLSVPVTVNDGVSTSAVYHAVVTVAGANDAPTITGQTSVQTNEDEAITLQLSFLTVSDADNTYPDDFTLQATAGAHYTVNGTTISPEANYSGTLSIPVTVNDGVNTSAPFQLQLTVVSVNDAPTITAQSALSVYRNQTLELSFSNLQVTDIDNTYPNGYSIIIHNGSNYTTFGYSITPVADYVGTLSVPVQVSDGIGASEIFTLNISVVKPPNVVPVITSQVSLSTYEDNSLTLQLSHLVVNDPDNSYPADFRLSVGSGSNYTVNGTTINPADGFSGQLSVPVTVSDLESTSATFTLIVDVLPVADLPLITSQAFLKIAEDETLTLEFAHLVVSDADSNYPTGFTMSISDGENYSVDGRVIIPDQNFNGQLAVPVTVNDGDNSSAPYQLLVQVESRNDAPVVTDTQPNVYYALGSDLLLFSEIAISDADDDSLSFAEIRIDSTQYELENDSLIYQHGVTVRGVYDASAGSLLFFGKAPISEYVQVLQAVTYRRSPPMPEGNKNMSLAVSDGQTVGETLTKSVSFENTVVALDIPSGFTPNGDGANDTWGIRSFNGAVFTRITIRVFSKHGSLVYKAWSLEAEWDGRSGGVMLPADSYFYLIDIEGPARKRIRGVVTLLR